MKKKLRVGLLLNDFQVAAWEKVMIQNIITSDFAEIVLVVVNDNVKPVPNKTLFAKIKNNFDKILPVFTRKILYAFYANLVDRVHQLPDAEQPVSSEAMLQAIPLMRVKTNRKKWSDYFFNEDINKIKAFELDILVRGGFGILRGEILSAAKYGIWSYHHGDNRINRGGPPGFWESMENWPETGSILQILTEDLDNGKVLYRSFSCTETLSIDENRNNYYWKTLSFMTRKMAELHRIGETAFFAKVEKDNKHPVFYSNRLYTHPSNYEFAKLLWCKIVTKICTRYKKLFRKNQWILMFDLKENLSSSLWRYKKILPPKDRFWADPHLVQRDNKYYIFIEEYFYATQKGHIAVMEMDNAGNYTTPQIILDKPYHLSYPFVFMHENEYYMIPESAANRTIELYKCTAFPNQWEFQMNLMTNVEAYDATLIHYQGKWWLFTNIVEQAGASCWDELFLFSSTNLFSEQWTPHPLNPIVSDCKTARPAGKLFMENGTLYRPSQNCSHAYGYGFNINEITQLDDEHYAETTVTQVLPNWDKDIMGTHTFNKVGGLQIIDAMYRRSKR